MAVGHRRQHGGGDGGDRQSQSHPEDDQGGEHSRQVAVSRLDTPHHQHRPGHQRRSERQGQARPPALGETAGRR